MNITYTQTNKDIRSADVFARMSEESMRRSVLTCLAAWWNVPYGDIKPSDIAVNPLTGRWSYEVSKLHPNRRYEACQTLHGFCASYPESNMPQEGRTCKVLAWYEEVDEATIDAYRENLDWHYPEPHKIIYDKPTGYPIGFEHLNGAKAEAHGKIKTAELVAAEKAARLA